MADNVLVVPVPEDLDIEAAILLNRAHCESHKAHLDLQCLQAWLYQAIHLSHSHGVAWFAAGMCYGRVGDCDTADRCFSEAEARGYPR